MPGTALIAVLVLSTLISAPAPSAARAGNSFRRIATFPVINNYCGPAAPNSCFNQLAVAEIVAASTNGKVLIYTDSVNERVGLVDISNPERPSGLGTIPVGGEPTSVAVAGRYALVGVNTSPSFVNPDGHLTVIDLVDMAIVHGALDLNGQPDSIAVSPDGRYAAIVIENERDEDFEPTDGAPPQLPAGELIALDMRPNHPSQWKMTHVSLIGLPGMKFPTDPEPEFVDINRQNVAVVSLQENNHFVLLDLENPRVIRHFPAGDVDLTEVDTEEEDIINFDSSLDNVLREPDGVAWISDSLFASADEGDLDGGSRGFTIYDTSGFIRFASNSTFEHLGGQIGHYPESRSENKGTEPEAVEFGRFQSEDLLFVGSERGSYVGVYRMNYDEPEFLQVLAAGVGPEGLLAIPEKGLFVVANEEDNDDGGVSGRAFRASITIFRYEPGAPIYPTVVSESNSPPIPWAALSALAAHPTLPNLGYTVSDSAYAQGFIYPMDISSVPARIIDRIAVTGVADLDLEGVAVRSDGTLWLASEGNAGGSRPNRIFRASQTTGALIGSVVELPPSVHARRTGNGFEGIAVTGTAGVNEKVYVAFQREWIGDPAGKVRIGIYDPALDSWGFLYYPLDAVESPNGGFVGLSEIVSVGTSSFAVIERDNQAGQDARIKRIYRFSAAGMTPEADCIGTCNFPTVIKTLVRDLMPDLAAPGGAIIEKVEGLAVTADGRTLINTDNDAVDDSSGETQHIDLGVDVLP
jgi:hypothetical protein